MADGLDAVKHRKEMRDYYKQTCNNLYIKLRGVDTREQRVRYEKEISHNMNLIERYGFDFFPEMYTKPYIDKIAEIVVKL